MEAPTIRPGVTSREPTRPNLFAYFHNAAAGNAAIQQITALGVADEQLGVTPPEWVDGGEGMLLSLVCEPRIRDRIEAACRAFGAEVHRAPR